MEIKIGIITASDRASAGVYEDLSGKAIIDTMNEYIKGEWIREYRLIPDEQEAIERTMIELCDEARCSLEIGRAHV